MTGTIHDIRQQAGRRPSGADREGVQTLNYNPPIIWLLRKAGFTIRPPHYERFMINVLALGLPIGAIWGC